MRLEPMPRPDDALRVSARLVTHYERTSEPQWRYPQQAFYDIDNYGLAEADPIASTFDYNREV